VFDVTDAARWKSMSEDAICSMCAPAVSPDWPSFPPLSASPLDSAVVSNELEHELRSLVTQHRTVCLSVCFVVLSFSGSCWLYY